MKGKLISVLVAILWIAHADSSIRATIVQGEIPQRDTSRPWYSMRLPKLGSDPGTDFSSEAEDADGSSKVRMVSAQGQVLQCTVPSSPPSDAGDKAATGEHAFDDVDLILKNYAGKCFVRQEGWWTFEFCYNKEVVQVHKPTSEEDVEMRYVLGAFDEGFNDARRRDVKKTGRPGSPYTQWYGNGTMCDVEGHIRPREIVVKYICADDAMHMASIQREAGEVFLVKGVRELATCVYELEFISTAICAHHLYQNSARRNALEIKCELEKGQGAFKGLSTKKYHKSSLTL